MDGSKRQGRPKTMQDSEILELLRQLPRPFITSRDVAEEFDLTKMTGRRRLNALVDDGPLVTDKIGSGGRVWYHHRWEERVKTPA